MGRPSGGYEIDGEPVPSVTELLSHFMVDDFSRLERQHVAYAALDDVHEVFQTLRAARNPEDIPTLIDQHLPRLNANKWMDQPSLILSQAADVGTRVHTAMDYLVQKQPVPANDWSIWYRGGDTLHGDPDQHNTSIENAIQAGMSFLKDHDVRPLYSETAMVSRLHRYGGTGDIIGYVDDDAVCILDWKTSSKIKPAYLLQCAAYGLLAAECLDLGGKPVTKVAICRLDKKTGQYEYRERSGEPVFRAMARWLDLLRIHHDPVDWRAGAGKRKSSK